MGSNFNFVMPKYDLKSLVLVQEILALHLQVEIAVIKYPQNSYLRQENGMTGYEVTGSESQYSVRVNLIELIICSIHTLPIINKVHVLIGLPKDIVKLQETQEREIKNLLPVNSYYTT